VGGRTTSYPPELRERAAGMVAEVQSDYPSDWPAIVAVAEKVRSVSGFMYCSAGPLTSASRTRWATSWAVSGAATLVSSRASSRRRSATRQHEPR
jgi:hypothetical protein